MSGNNMGCTDFNHASRRDFFTFVCYDDDGTKM